MPKLIPTEYKTKIPKTHSFPVGAEVITEVLSGVPQFQELSIFFTGIWSLGNPSSRTPVIEVNFRNISLGRFTPREFEDEIGESWQIKVYPVLRELKGQIKPLLIREGLPRLANWLSKDRSETWLAERKSASILYDRSSNSIDFVFSG